MLGSVSLSFHPPLHPFKCPTFPSSSLILAHRVPPGPLCSQTIPQQVSKPASPFAVDNFSPLTVASTPFLTLSLARFVLPCQRPFLPNLFSLRPN